MSAVINAGSTMSKYGVVTTESYFFSKSGGKCRYGACWKREIFIFLPISSKGVDRSSRYHAYLGAATVEVSVCACCALLEGFLYHGRIGELKEANDLAAADLPDMSKRG